MITMMSVGPVLIATLMEPVLTVLVVQGVLAVSQSYLVADWKQGPSTPKRCGYDK